MKAQTQKENANIKREYDEKNFEIEARSRIPKMPKKTQSLEGKESSSIKKKATNKNKASTTSMIPRPEWKNYSRKPLTPDSLEMSKSDDSGQDIQDFLQKSIKFCSTGNQILGGNKIEEEFATFKKNVLKIPEYWTDAGHTVTNVLKNAVDIIKKQYPTADVEAFETELQNILKATEDVRQQILMKTEDIVNQANEIYSLSFYKNGFKEEGIRAIAKKMEELKEDVNSRKQVFGNLLKCGTGLKQILEMEQLLKLREEASGELSERKPNVKERGVDSKMVQKGNSKRVGTPKTKTHVDVGTKMGLQKNMTHPCGDILKQDAKAVIELINNRTVGIHSNKLKLEDKSSQTQHPWNNDMVGLENSLISLNNQILELHRMCKDHISKFKSFNLQIKLRGVCNKGQGKEMQVWNDDKFHFGEKNDRIQQYCNSQDQDLESAIKQKDLDIQQRNRVINKQKKLLHVRDELIEMLKNRCRVDVEDS